MKVHFKPSDETLASSAQNYHIGKLVKFSDGYWKTSVLIGITQKLDLDTGDIQMILTTTNFQTENEWEAEKLGTMAPSRWYWFQYTIEELRAAGVNR